MKKFLLLLVLSAVFCLSLLASIPVSVQGNVGFGYLEGKRYLTRNDGTVDNKVHLKADGIDAGFLLSCSSVWFTR